MVLLYCRYLSPLKGSVENLAHSFRLDSGKGIDYDWDGLKRVYEDIEAKDLENSLVEAIGELNNSINKTKSKSKIVPALVMVHFFSFVAIHSAKISDFSQSISCFAVLSSRSTPKSVF